MPKPQSIEEEFAEFNREHPPAARRQAVPPSVPAPASPSFTTVLATVWKTLMAILLITFLLFMAWAFLTG